MKSTQFVVALVASANAAVNFCPGSLELGGGSGDNACCVGGSANLKKPGASPTCATLIPTTASNYEQLASSASSMYLDGNGKITATAGGDGPTETGTSASSATSTTETSDQNASSTGSADTSEKTGSGDQPDGAAHVAATGALKACAVVMAYVALQ